MSMTEAELIGSLIIGLAAIIGLYVTVTNPLLKVNQQLTELNVNQKNILEKGRERDERLDIHGVKLDDHEIRITRVEEKVK